MHLLQTAQQLQGYSLHAVDGEIGRVEAFYFDGVTWAVCYLLVHSADWLQDQYVLISPVVIGEVDDEQHTIDIELTRQQIKNSPLLTIGSPLAGQSAAERDRPYREAGAISGFAITGGPMAFPLPAGKSAKNIFEKMPLYSTAEVRGYEVTAQDGEMGAVEDFVIDTQYWLIRYLQVDADAVGTEKHVLISPDWGETLSDKQPLIHLHMKRELIKGAPDFNPDREISRAYELQLFRHYGRPVYWHVDNKIN